MNRCSHFSDCIERASLSVRVATHEYANGHCDYHTVAWNIINARKTINKILDNRCKNEECSIARPYD